VRYVAIAGWFVAVAAAIVLGAAVGGAGAPVAGAASAAALVASWLWLPRAAHAAFDGGRYQRAARRYRVVGALAWTATRVRAAMLSRAGCAVALGDRARAEELLAAIDPADLDAIERAVWLNNRACVDLDAGRDAGGALALADEASALRPDVAAIQHTRGMALLAVGRVDDAIAVLDGMRAAGELAPRLEADRCRELARAWARKGETAYAEDYRLRAEALRLDGHARDLP
jgi:predicted Zn-dependent protease